MTIAYVADGHYFRLPNGDVYVQAVYGYEFWKRYLDVFDDIVVIARGKDVSSIDINNKILASGKNVKFEFIDDFKGIKGLTKNYFHVSTQMAEILEKYNCITVRLPSALSSMATRILLRRHKKFACEIAANPAETYDERRGAKLIQYMMYKNCYKACISANGVLYVTKSALQETYPSHAKLFGEDSNYFDTYAANVYLPDSCFIEQQELHFHDDPIKFIHVANIITGSSKGHYICLEIIKKLNEKGIYSEITFVGDGPEVVLLKHKCKEFGISNKVRFIGRIARKDELLKTYRQADIFLLPSKTEGMPRSLLEAMASGLVCFASNVGGTLELLEEPYMTNWNDSDAFVQKIISVVNNEKVYHETQINNILKAREYRYDILQSRRIDFYKKLKNLAEK